MRADELPDEIDHDDRQSMNDSNIIKPCRRSSPDDAVSVCVCLLFVIVNAIVGAGFCSVVLY